MNKRVYLAGPDVFLPNAKECGETLKELLHEHGLEGVFPLDVEIALAENATGRERSRLIFLANVGLIRSCRGVLANMTPFRGPSADAGTAWEMGYANGLGLPVIGYSLESSRYAERVVPDKFEIESFGLVDNLMLVHGCEGVAATLVNVGGGSAVWFAAQQMAALLSKT